MDFSCQQLQFSQETSASTADPSNITNTSPSFQSIQHYNQIKSQNEFIKEQYDKLLLENNELKEKLRLAEEFIKKLEEQNLQFLKEKMLKQDGESIEADDDFSETSLMFKTQSPLLFVKQRNQQLINNNNEALQKKILGNLNRYYQGDSKQCQKNDEYRISPIDKQKQNTYFEQIMESYKTQNPELDIILDRKREGSATPNARVQFMKYKTLQDLQINNKQYQSEFLIQGGQLMDQGKLYKSKQETKQIKVEKMDQIVAVGYDSLKEGQQFKPKALMTMMKDKNWKTTYNNSSRDINFFKKELKINNLKSNILQKNFSSKLYGNNLKAPSEESYDNSLQQTDQSQQQYSNGNKSSQINAMYSRQPSQVNTNQSMDSQDPSSRKNSDNIKQIGMQISKNKQLQNNSNGLQIPDQIIVNQNCILYQKIQNTTNQSNNTHFVENQNQNENNCLNTALINCPIAISNQNNNNLNNEEQNYINNCNNILLNESAFEQNSYSSNDNDKCGLNSEEFNLKSIIQASSDQQFQQQLQENPELLKYYQECNQYFKLYKDLKQYCNIGEFLFEEFMILGPDLKELKDSLETLPNPFVGVKGSKLEYFKNKAQPTILFNKPNYSSPFFCEKRQAAAQFAFPQGLNYYRYRKQTDLANMPSRFKDIILLSLCQQRDQGITDDTFILNIKGESISMNINNSLQVINPNSILYAVCYQQEDFMVVTDENTGEKTIFLFPVVYCFLTYYPFVHYFIEIIQEIANRIKTIRLVRSSFSGAVDNNLQQLDLEQVIKILEQDHDLCLSLKSLQIKDVKQQRILTHQLVCPSNYLLHPEQQAEKMRQNQNKQYTNVSFRVPSYDEMEYIESLEAAYLTFSNLPYYDFQFILTLIMLEKKVVFLSKNRTLLTHTTMTFYSLFKPFKYPCPYIFLLTDDLIDFLEAPMPIVVGVNLCSDKFEYEFGYNDQCYYVDLDKNNIFTQNQSNISKVQSQRYKFFNYKEKIKPLFNEINNHITSKQFGNKIKKVFTRSHHEKTLVYKSDSTQQANLKCLLQLIRKSLEECIIQRLPNHPIIIEDTQELDIEQIKKIVLKDNSEQNFLSSFLQTQVFSYFVEYHYF